MSCGLFNTIFHIKITLKAHSNSKNIVYRVLLWCGVVMCNFIFFLRIFYFRLIWQLCKHNLVQIIVTLLVFIRMCALIFWMVML